MRASHAAPLAVGDGGQEGPQRVGDVADERHVDTNVLVHLGRVELAVDLLSRASRRSRACR